MDKLHPYITVLIIVAVTALLRFLPFMLFGENRKTPEWLSYLGKVLPYAVMGMLVVYCLKDISFTAAPFGIPEIVCVGITVLLHVWKRNTLLSVGVSTACYMVIIRII